MPKWMLRPSYVPGSESPMPLRYVLVDGSKSAEPPINSGSSPAIAFITTPPASRVATLPFSGVNVGQGNFAGGVPAWVRSHCAPSCGFSASTAPGLRSRLAARSRRACRARATTPAPRPARRNRARAASRRILWSSSRFGSERLAVRRERIGARRNVADDRADRNDGGARVGFGRRNA